jgi:serine/threonine-protein kinase
MVIIGETISHYRILEKLGGGGMGVVYKAEDIRLGRVVALKFLPDRLAHDREALDRFGREAHAASALNHPNICTIYDVDEASGSPFLVMEFLEGQTLKHRFAGAPAPLDELLNLGVQIAEALEAAHAKGIIHRDIKPANIFVTNLGQAKVLDFGLAKRTGSLDPGDATISAQTRLTTPGVSVGTLAYMSPEQVRGEELDVRTDLFSFGLVLYELATGSQAFVGSTGAVIGEAILNRAPTPAGRVNPALPPKLDEIIAKALEKDRKLRYQSAGEMRTDLARVKRDTEVARYASGRETQLLQSDGSFIRKRRTWAVGSLALVACGALLGTGLYLNARRDAPIDSLAVLPFVNATADPNTEYLADGITEAVINSLSQLPNVAVMSRSSVFRYKGRDIDPQEVGRELNVRAVLASRVEQRGDDISISTELVDVRNNQHIWGDRYNRTVADVLSLQDEISRDITNELRLKLSREQREALTRRYTENTEAYQSYLKGRYYWNKRTEDGLHKAISLFQDAIAKDPAYALAHAGVADCYTLLGAWSYLPPKDSYPRGKAAALRALELDEKLAEAHASLARNKMGFDWDWSGARAEFERALQLNPNYATAHYWYSYYYLAMGRLDDALREVQRALELDPLSLNINAEVGRTLLYQRRYDAAIEQELKTLELDPAFALAHELLAMAYLQTGRYREALAESRKTLYGTVTGRAYLKSGDVVNARRAAASLKELSKTRYVSAHRIALAYIGLEDKEEAFRWLEKAYEERSLRPDFMRVDPWYDVLRSDSRFADLMSRAGLRP